MEYRTRDDVSRFQVDISQQQPPHEGLEPDDQIALEVGEPVSTEQEDEVRQAEDDRVEEQPLDIPEPFAEPPHQVAPEEELLDQTYEGKLLEEFKDQLGVEPRKEGREDKPHESKDYVDQVSVGSNFKTDGI